LWEECLREALNKGTESTEVNWKGRKLIALLAFPACQEDGTCAALRHADAKDSFKISLVKWFQELSFLISFDPYEYTDLQVTNLSHWQQVCFPQSPFQDHLDPQAVEYF